MWPLRFNNFDPGPIFDYKDMTFATKKCCHGLLILQQNPFATKWFGPDLFESV